MLKTTALYHGESTKRSTKNKVYKIEIHEAIWRIYANCSTVVLPRRHTSWQQDWTVINTEQPTEGNNMNTKEIRLETTIDDKPERLISEAELLERLRISIRDTKLLEAAQPEKSRSKFIQAKTDTQEQTTAGIVRILDARHARA